MGTVKTLKGKLTVILIVFMMLFGNLGFTMSAIATSEAFEVIDNGFFRKDEIKFNAYFEDEDGNEITELTGDVNEDLKLVLEIFPQVEGFLKDGTIKAVSSDGSDINFEFTAITQNLLETSKFEETIEQVKEESTEEPVEVEESTEEIKVDEGKDKEKESDGSIQNILDKVVNKETTDNILSTVVQNSIVASKENEENASQFDAEKMLNALVDEEALVKEKTEEELYEEELNQAIFDIAIKDKNEIKVSNIIEDTKIVVDLSYVQKEELNLNDLIKSIKLQLSGNFINKKLKDVKIGLEEEVKVGWKYSSDFSLKSEFTKFSPFKIGNVSGTIVENSIVIERNVENEKYLPIKSSVIEVNVPKINDKYPKEVNVIANKLLATLGQDVGETEFNENNWSYDQESGKIEIKVTNKKDSKAQNTFGIDEYVIIYRFEDYVEEDVYSLENNVKARVEEYSANENKVSNKQINKSNSVNAQRDELLRYSIETSEDKVSKGKIYANYNSEFPVYETEYKTQVKVNILTSEIFENLKITSEKEVYKTAVGTSHESAGIMYKNVKFNYSQLVDILSAGGEIVLKNINNEILYVLNKDNVKAAEDCTVNLQVEEVIVEINGVKRNGTIDFEFTKAIGKSNLDKKTFVKIDSVESKIKATAKYIGLEEEIELEEVSIIKYFEETKTNATLKINKDSLATIKSNGNVEFKIELNNNLLTSDLYVNPSFEIVLPTPVKTVNLQSINILHGGELKVKEFTTYKHDDESLRIKVDLEGAQTMFSASNMTNGTNIIINADLDVEDYTATRKDKVKMYYYNEGVTFYGSQTKWSISKPYTGAAIRETNGFAFDIVEYQGPTGLIAINAIKGYDDTTDILRSIKQGEILKTISRTADEKLATMEVAVLNNTDSDCNNVVLLGRIPFKGNRDIKTGKDLGTTIDSEMLDGILPNLESEQNTATVYYSENGNATKDLNDPNNGWKKDIGTMLNIKSYLIVVDGSLKSGDSLKYNYTFRIPKQLGYEQKMLGSFVAYYDEIDENYKRAVTTVADPVGLVTEVGAKLEVSMTSELAENEEVGEARYIKYKVKVDNVGSIDLDNVLIELKGLSYLNICQKTNAIDKGDDGYESLPNYNNYVTIESLKAGESAERTLVVKTKERPENLEELHRADEGLFQDEAGYYYLNDLNEKEYIQEVPKDLYINPYASVTIGESTKAYTTNRIKNKLIDSTFDIQTTVYATNRTFETGEDISYVLNVVNISDEKVKNIKVENVMPKEFEFVEFYDMFDVYEYEYDEETHILTFEIPELDANTNTKMRLTYNIANMKDVDATQVVNQYRVKTKNVDEKGTAIKTELVGAKLDVSQETSLINNEVLECDEFEIKYHFENKGRANSKEINIEVEMPEDLKIVKVSSKGHDVIRYTIDGNKIKGTVEGVEFNHSASLIIQTRSHPLDEGEKIRDVQVKASATEDNIGDLGLTPIDIKIYDNPDRELTDDEKEQIKDDNTVKDTVANDDYLNDRDKVNADTNNNNNNSNTNNNNESNKPDSGNNNGSSDNSNNGSNNGGTNNNQNSGNNSNSSNQTDNGNQGTTGEKIKTYRIAGEVWKDENKDGVKDDSEDRLKQIKVSLYQGNSQVKTSRTDSLGRYSFNDVKVGEYVVVFEYNGGLYVATTYKKSGIEENRNSDVMEVEEGKAVTNEINITNSDQQVDLGLQQRNDFDLAIEKYISRAVVNTNGKETVTEFDNASLEKLEIKSKELTNTTIKLEYKIVVANIGNVNGSVNIVKDYLPKTLRFDQKENPDWYINSDGVLCNDTLENTEIKPGQTKELKLVLNKVMTADNTGTIVNKVELSGVVNDDSLDDKTENNVATQEMIVTVSTGRTVQVTLFVACIAGFAVLFNFVNIKTILTGKKIYK